MVCGEVIAAQVIQVYSLDKPLETGNSVPSTDFVDHVIKAQA